MYKYKAISALSPPIAVIPCLHNIVQINALYIATSPDTTSIENQPGVIEEQERAPTEEGKREHCHTTVKNV